MKCPKTGIQKHREIGESETEKNRRERERGAIPIPNPNPCCWFKPKGSAIPIPNPIPLNPSPEPSCKTMGAIEPTSPPPYPPAATAASLLVYTGCPAKIYSRKASPSPSGGLPAMLSPTNNSRFLRERGCVDDVYSKVFASLCVWGFFV
jgi:hypothetical protein